MSKKFIFGGSYSGVLPYGNIYSLTFDGVDESLNLGRVMVTEGASNISFSFWVNFSVSASGTQYPFGKYTANGLYCGFDVPTKRITFGNITLGVTTQYNSLSNAIPFLGTWYHVAWVFDGGLAPISRIKLYVNGVLDTATPPSFPSTLNSDTTNFALGGLGGPSVTTFNMVGNIDEFCIFDYSLSSSEVSDIYNGGVPNNLMALSVAKRPEHYYRNGDGDTFPTITDVGETGGNNGTMVNMEITDIVTNVP